MMTELKLPKTDTLYVNYLTASVWIYIVDDALKAGETQRRLNAVAVLA